MKRKSFTTEFKSKVAIEALKGHRTVSELASEFGVHATQVNGWKKQLLAGANDIFSKKPGKQIEDHEAEKERLYSEIGRLKMESDWLKKRQGVSVECPRETVTGRSRTWQAQYSTSM